MKKLVLVLIAMFAMSAMAEEGTPPPANEPAAGAEQAPAPNMKKKEKKSKKKKKHKNG